jgi:tetratricopeptide (TPR) repeat protein
MEAQQSVRQLLTLGVQAENRRDWLAALSFYAQATRLSPESDMEGYFSHNNLAYVLVQLKRYDEARFHAEAAIDVNDEVHNAHKNLGLALMGLRQLEAAAQSLIRASWLRPNDLRAWEHLRDLLAQNPLLLEDRPRMKAEIDELKRHMKQQGAPQPH